MSDMNPTLAELDTDGALAEAASRVDGHTRAAFFARSAAFIGGTAAFTALAPGIASAAVGSGDIAILNYALTLEYLEAAFYKEAVNKGALSGEAKRFATVVAEHEAAHVTALKGTLGSKAGKKPAFDFKGTTGSQATFLATAKVLEDTGVKAYLGQAGNIKDSAVLKAAASILPVEARHAAWVANILKQSPAPESFQSSSTMAEVLAAVKGTGFVPSLASAAASPGVSGTPSVTG